MFIFPASEKIKYQAVMSRSKRNLILILLGFMICCPMPASAQFVTIARKIKAKLSDGKDVASVILDAGASKVYNAVTDSLTSDSRCRILKRDDAKKFVEFTHDSNSLTLQVDSLASGLSQITAVAEKSKNSSDNTANSAVQAVLRVCHLVGTKCTLKDVDPANPK
jgi:hypothetical protein